MARHTTNAVANNAAGVRTATGVSGTIIGIELVRNLPNGVKIRPTNVTATCGVSEAEPDQFILLHNGPKGGFSQNYNGADTLFFNAVVAAVITDQ